MPQLKLILIQGDAADAATVRQMLDTFERLIGDEAPAEIAEDVRPPRKRTRSSLFLVCHEHPGRTFDAHEAAEMAGVRYVTAASAVSRAESYGNDWARVGAYHVRRAKGPDDATVDVPPPPEGGRVHWTKRPENRDRVSANARARWDLAKARADAAPSPDPAPAPRVEAKPVPVAVAAEDPNEARPRQRGGLGPINPNVAGGAAVITHAEVKPRQPAVHLGKARKDEDQ